EALAQWRGDKAGSSGGADQREGRQIDAHGTRRRPFPDDEIELEILHRRIEDFLDRRVEPMNFVDEQDVARLQVGEKGRKVARPRDDRTGCRTKADPQLAGDDLGERRLAQARRTEEKDMIEGFATRARGGDEDLQVGAQLLLSDELVDRLRTQRAVDSILRRRFRGKHAWRRHWLSS